MGDQAFDQPVAEGRRRRPEPTRLVGLAEVLRQALQLPGMDLPDLILADLITLRERMWGRLLDHSRKAWADRSLAFSYQIIGQSVLPHHLKELENDLIGNFFENFRKAPAFQFGNGR